MTSKEPPPRVFISYAHDSPQHKDLVLQFATFLRVEVGIDVHIDRWYEDHRRDWATWASEHLQSADFILVIASPAYRRRADGQALLHDGHGAQFEAAIIRNNLMRDLPAETQRVLPVVLPGGSVDDIPTFLCGYSASHYRIDEFTIEGVEDLRRAFSGQPAHLLPDRGPYTPISSRDNDERRPGVMASTADQSHSAEADTVRPRKATRWSAGPQAGTSQQGDLNGWATGAVIQSSSISGGVHVHQVSGSKKPLRRSFLSFLMLALVAATVTSGGFSNPSPAAANPPSTPHPSTPPNAPTAPPRTSTASNPPVTKRPEFPDGGSRVIPQAASGRGVPGAGVGLAKQTSNVLTGAFIDDKGTLNVTWAADTQAWHAPRPIAEDVAVPGTPVTLVQQTGNRLVAAFMDKNGALNIASVEGSEAWKRPLPVSGRVGKPGGTVGLAKLGADTVVAAFVDNGNRINISSATGRGDWKTPMPVSPPIGVPGAPIAISKQHNDLLTAAFVDRTGTLNVTWAPISDIERGWHEPTPVGGKVTIPGAAVSLAQQSPQVLTAAMVDNEGALNIAWAVENGKWTPPVRVGGPIGVPGSTIALANQNDNTLTAVFVDKNGTFNVAWVESNKEWQKPRPVGNPITRAGANVALAKQTDNVITAALLSGDGSFTITWTSRTGSWNPPQPVR